MKKSRKPKWWKAWYRAGIAGNATPSQFSYADNICIGTIEDGTIDVLLLSPPSQDFKPVNYYKH